MAGIGLKCFGFARLVSETDGARTYGTGMLVGKAIQANLQWQTDDSKLFADDAVAETYNGITGLEIDATADDLTPEMEMLMLGTEKDDETEEYWDGGDPGPVGAYGYIRVLQRGNFSLFRVEIIPKITFRRNNEDMQTKGQNVTWGTASVHGSAAAVFSSAGKSRFRKKKYFSTWEAAYAYLLSELNISGNTQGLTLNTTAATVAAGSTVTLTPISVPSGVTASDLTWASDNEAAATVSSGGVVTGVAAGEAVISAEYNGLVARARVTVTAAQ